MIAKYLLIAEQKTGCDQLIEELLDVWSRNIIKLLKKALQSKCLLRCDPTAYRNHRSRGRPAGHGRSYINLDFRLGLLGIRQVV